MNTIEIKENNESRNCECCGSYQSSELDIRIVKDGKESEYFHFCDKHFGGGDWDGSKFEIYLLLLKDIFNVHYINIETPGYSMTLGKRYDMPSDHTDKEEKEFLKLSPSKSITLRISEDVFPVLDVGYEAITIIITDEEKMSFVNDGFEKFYDNEDFIFLVIKEIIKYEGFELPIV